MKKIYPLLFVFALLAQTAAAQRRICYTNEVTAARRAVDAAYDEGVKMTEDGLRKFVESGQANAVTGNRSIRTIPVVVHVVYNTAAQNVSTASIQAMINQMNKDYTKTNSDLSSARAVVQPLAADAQIQFCLAQQTPTGAATNGIDRVSTAKTCWDPNTEADKMKSSSTGGANAWDTHYYLNFWVVSLCGSSPQTGGVAGYAYVPATGNGLHGSSIDGVVIDYSIGLSGHVWTHETGHYLGCHHTWGDLAANACGNVFPDTDDGFSDTPDSKEANFGCTPIVSCTGNSSYGDLIEDFMDYSDCTALFTTQQVNYMNNILTNIRSSLLNTNKCTATGGPLASFTANPTNICVGQTVTFTNTSTGSGNTYSWTFTGGTPSSSTATNPTVTYNTPGTYSVSLTATNGSGNNTNTQTNLIYVAGVNSLPLAEGFEGSTFPPTGWILNNPDASTTWARTTSFSGFGTSSACAFVDNYNYNNAGQKDWLIIPPYNFTNVSSGRIKWDYAYAQYPGVSDSLDVLYSTNCGATWTSIWKKGGAGLGTATSTLNLFQPTSAQWKRDSVSLASLNGQGSVIFAFKNTTAFGNNVYLDNINIYNSVTTPQAPVADFIGTPTTVVVGNSVSFTDISANAPTSWSWTFAGGTPGTSTQQNPVITYNTIGTYNVSLTAANALGNNTATKNLYINVIQGGACDTLSNFTDQDTAVYYTVPSFLGSGYLSGNNSFGDLAKAEFYTNTQSRKVTGAYYLFAKKAGSGSFQACVWDASGAGGSPGASPIASVTLSIPSISTTNYTFVAFPTQPSITGNFYIGFILPQTAGDTIAVATTSINSPSVGQGWEEWADTAWHSYSDYWGQYYAGFEISNIIYPVVCAPSTAPTASFTGSPTTGCAGTTVSFTSTSTGSPTSYSWTFTGGTPAVSTAQNPSVVYDSPGSFAVSLTVSNNGGNNTASQTNYITIYSKPSLATSSSAVLCYGGSTGSATVAATGGTPAYTYNWSGGGSASTISNKAAGTYTVTVSDTHQCSSTASVNIGQPLAALGLTPNATDAVCNQLNGSATVTATGGAGGYTYSWNTGPTTQTLSNVGAGIYSVTVHDANNCSATSSMTVNNATSNFAVTINADNAGCGQSNGSAVALPNNGTFGVTYHWNTGANSGSISSLAPGTYSVTVTNNVGCTASATASVGNNTAPSAVLNPTNGTCQTPTSIDLVVSGGSSPFIFHWSNGAATEDLQNIPAGAYSVTITDAKNCTATNSATVTDASNVSVTFTTQNPTGGNNNGSITVNPSGGVPPYSYQWSTGATIQTISNLPAGTYTVTITDNTGCTKIQSVTLSVITAIDDASAISSIRIFPNPAKDICKIEIELSETNDIQLQLFNNLGQQLWEKKESAFKNGTEVVDMSKLSGGIYYIKAVAGSMVETKRVIKE